MSNPYDAALEVWNTRADEKIAADPEDHVKALLDAVPNGWMKVGGDWSLIRTTRVSIPMIRGKLEQLYAAIAPIFMAKDMDPRAQAELTMKAIHDHRMNCFAPGNDKLWGPGNWIECSTCPPDATGWPIFHHKDQHADG